MCRINQLSLCRLAGDLHHRLFGAVAQQHRDGTRQREAFSNVSPEWASTLPLGGRMIRKETNDRSRRVRPCRYHAIGAVITIRWSFFRLAYDEIRKRNGKVGRKCGLALILFR